MSVYMIHAIEWVITAVLAGVVGYVGATMRKKQTHDEAMEIGMKVLLRKSLIDSFDYYCNQNHKMTVERRREILEAYDAYSNLGGDGVISGMVDRMTSENGVWIERG